MPEEPENEIEEEENEEEIESEALPHVVSNMNRMAPLSTISETSIDNLVNIK